MTGRVENLKPWAKGVSGNPGGRPKKRLLDEVLTELMEDGSGQDAHEIGCNGETRKQHPTDPIGHSGDTKLS